jgi:6,7-dimethyl-8-ribityllumazine synthase
LATVFQNLSSQKLKFTKDFSDTLIGIVVSEWNNEITEKLFDGALERLLIEGVKKEHIIRLDVPGSYELSLGSQWLAQRADINAVISLGCVIQGETPHFDFICQAVAKGITDVNLKYNKPVIFGVLTTLNQLQAQERAGGKHGNKGDEAAITALKMLAI